MHEQQAQYMHIDNLLSRALNLDFLSAEEGVFLFENAATADLMYVGNALRQKKVPGNVVTWIIDRNSNTTNVCIAKLQVLQLLQETGA